MSLWSGESARSGVDHERSLRRRTPTGEVPVGANANVICR